jgi:fermentation-respiration switch protein FrsA (DUF1100 family)
MEYIKWIVISVVGLYFILGFLYYLFQDRFIFVRYDLKGKYNLVIDRPHKELLLKSEDGETLHGLWIKAENPKGLIMYFHGNTGSLKRWGKVAAQFTDYGYDVLAPDYRGYGKSTGSPSEKSLISDAGLFYKSALEHYNEDQIVIYGRSLGSGVAVQLAAKYNPKLLILETPFKSLLNVARSQVPIFPYKIMLKHHFRSDHHIRNVKCPIIIMHGTSDNQVYYKSALKLYAKVSDRDNVVFHTFKGGDHNNLSSYSQYNKLLSEVLDGTN